MIIAHKQTKKNKELKLTMQQWKLYMDRCNLRQWKRFDQVRCFVFKNTGKNEMFAKNFIQMLKILWLDSYVTVLAFSLNSE